jgi:hypothetical protein
LMMGLPDSSLIYILLSSGLFDEFEQDNSNSNDGGTHSIEFFPLSSTLPTHTHSHSHCFSRLFYPTHSHSSTLPTHTHTDSLVYHDVYYSSGVVKYGTRSEFQKL